MPDDPKPVRRISSDDTVPIPREELLRMMGAAPDAGDYQPTADDDTPTSPDLSKLVETHPCQRCKGSGKAVEERPDGTYHGPVPCPRCGASGIDPDPPSQSEPPPEPT